MANSNNYKNEERTQNKLKPRLRGEWTRNTEDEDRATQSTENTDLNTWT